MISIKVEAKDKSIVQIEGIIKMPVSIIHNADAPERLGKSCRISSHLSSRVCVGPPKFRQTNHVFWSSNQPSGKYLTFEIEWPETPKGSNYFEGYSILVLVTDNMHPGDLVLVSTENGLRLLDRARGGKFLDVHDHHPVKRSSFIPIGTVWQESGWLTGEQTSER
jgi:hypothetical protein